MSLLSDRLGNDLELPLLWSRLAEPQRRKECLLSSLSGTDWHLANKILSFGFPAEKRNFTKLIIIRDTKRNNSSSWVDYISHNCHIEETNSNIYNGINVTHVTLKKSKSLPLLLAVRSKRYVICYVTKIFTSTWRF